MEYQELKMLEHLMVQIKSASHTSEATKGIKGKGAAGNIFVFGILKWGARICV